MTDQDADIIAALRGLGVTSPVDVAGGLSVRSPCDGRSVCSLPMDDAPAVSEKIIIAASARRSWSMLSRKQREQLLEAYSVALRKAAADVGKIIHRESGKALKETVAETQSAADQILKTIQDATLPEISGMLRRKERPPVGVVGLITSFNFPIAVAHWTMAPALLAGNAVVWKPSEKTPLAALAAKAIFDRALGEHAAVLQVVAGGREAGEALVAHESVDMVSATGSVAMGQAIHKTLAAKRYQSVPPILELGGNNAAIISEKLSAEHLEWSLAALMHSFLGSTGQRCTNTRRLFVHHSVIQNATAILKRLIGQFVDSYCAAGGIDPANPYGYAALIDVDAYRRFERAKEQVLAAGGELFLGRRLYDKTWPGAYYVEPALGLLEAQEAVMHAETFAPLLYVVPYRTLDEALALADAPENAGLVAAIYTQSQSEADQFARTIQAGHALINSPKGTGTPAYGMGFGGNKHSGCGEILSSADPLAPFVRHDRFTRIAQNKDVVMT